MQEFQVHTCWLLIISGNAILYRTEPMPSLPAAGTLHGAAVGQGLHRSLHEWGARCEESGGKLWQPGSLHCSHASGHHLDPLHLNTPQIGF